MDTNIEYKELEQEIERVLKELDLQLENTNLNNSEFHLNLIDIISKNPELKEIIQFIVSNSDRLETKQDIIKDILSDSIKDLSNAKKKMLDLMLSELQTIKESKKSKVRQKLDNYMGLLKDNPKTLLFILFGILVVIGFIISPTELITLAKIIFVKV